MQRSDIPQAWINTNKVQYFDLQEYISKIKLRDNVLYHMEDTANSFSKYIDTLARFFDYHENEVLLYWLDHSLQEMQNSASIERHSFKNVELFDGNLFFDTLAINHERIKTIHKFVCEHSETHAKLVGEYRDSLVNVGIELSKDDYQVLWYGAEVEDIKAFMNSFIKFYKTSNLSSVYSNPFIKSALAHLLFVRIHPFYDGNGRVARIIQSISFTSGINKLYGTNLKLSPLNVSQNIKMYVDNYVNYINRIYFDLEHDNNENINRYLDFMLNMYDEQLYYQTNRIPQLEAAYSRIEKKEDLDIYGERVYSEISKARVRKLFK